MSVVQRSGRRAIAPVVALLLGATSAIAQTPQPVTGGFVARAAAAPSDRIQLSAEQVKTILTARYPAIITGASEDNLVTIVLASNGDYVASGTSQQAIAGMVRAAGIGAAAGGGAGGGAFAASGSGASASPASAPSAASAGFGGSSDGTAPRAATAVIAPRTDDGQPHFIKLAGVGDVDASLVKDMYSTRFAAGEVSVNAITIRVVTLKGTAMK